MKTGLQRTSIGEIENGLVHNVEFLGSQIDDLAVEGHTGDPCVLRQVAI